MRSRRADAFSLVLVPLSLWQTLSAQVQPTRAELRNPLELIHPIETVADVQRELNQLEARSANVDVLLAENAKNIYGGTSQALNGTVEAALGPIFGHEAEYQGIEKTIAQATRDAIAAST